MNGHGRTWTLCCHRQPAHHYLVKRTYFILSTKLNYTVTTPAYIRPEVLISTLCTSLFELFRNSKTQVYICRSMLLRSLLIKENLLIWLDDILIHSKMFNEHLEIVIHFSAHCRQHGFVSNLARCNMNTKRVTCSGRHTAPEGTILYLHNLEGFLGMPQPTTDAKIDHFNASKTKIRVCIPDNTALTAPFQEFLTT